MKRLAISVLLMMCLEASAQVTPAPGDQIETLVFTGTATCIAQPGVANASATCSGSGPITGTYSLDLTTNTIVGSWSFSTPFGVVSSHQTSPSDYPFPGCGYGDRGGQNFNEPTYVWAFFEIQTYIEYPCTVIQEFSINLYFPPTDTAEVGALLPAGSSPALASGNACYYSGTNGYGRTCDLYYSITGTTALASASLQVTTTTLPTATSSQPYSTTLAAIYGSGAAMHGRFCQGRFRLALHSVRAEFCLLREFRLRLRAPTRLLFR